MNGLTVMLPFDAVMGFVMVAVGLIWMIPHPDVESFEVVPLQNLVVGGALFLTGVASLVSSLL